MLPTVYLAMFGWIPFVLNVFKRFSPSQAAVFSFIAGTLFLPQAAIALPILPDYNKANAICYGILLATYLNDATRFGRFQFGWLDVPMVIWCLCPFITSLVNGLGPYDGFLNVLENTMSWGVPYFIGRLYLGSLQGMRQLAIAIAIGGLVYAPFCLYESRFSPQLHRMLYGYHAHYDFAQTMRMGGFRPNVFMQHGLQAAMWMMAATLLCVWLWHTGVLKRVRKVPMRWVVVFMLFTFFMMKSTGAYILFAIGLITLLMAKYLRTAIVMLLIAGLVSVYLHMGVSGTFSTENIERVTEFITQIAGEDRAGSLRFRLDNEQVLGEKSRQSPIFGWGGWGRGRIFNDDGEDVSVTDSLWIITFNTNGVVGLVSQFSTLLLPPVLFLLLRYPARTWGKPEVAPAGALAVILVLYAYDCTLNAMISPVFTLLSGGMAGLSMYGDQPDRPVRPQLAAAPTQTASAASVALAPSDPTARPAAPRQLPVQRRSRLPGQRFTATLPGRQTPLKRRLTRPLSRR